MGTASWIFWLSWMGVGVAYELWAVFTERKYGTLPLTRILRDRLARRFTLVKLGLLLFLAWLGLHFLLPLSW
jgi:hypothetical protein